MSCSRDGKTPPANPSICTRALTTSFITTVYWHKACIPPYLVINDCRNLPPGPYRKPEAHSPDGWKRFKHISIICRSTFSSRRSSAPILGSNTRTHSGPLLSERPSHRHDGDDKAWVASCASNTHVPCPTNTVDKLALYWPIYFEASSGAVVPFVWYAKKCRFRSFSPLPVKLHSSQTRGCDSVERTLH